MTAKSQVVTGTEQLPRPPAGAASTTAGAASLTGRHSLRVLTLVIAFACGLAVANIYYAQPLLEPIADTFHTSQGSATIVVTLTQLGYALGLVILVPLGDLLENRRLACRTLLGTALALAVASFAPSFGLFLVMSVLIGCTSVVVQVLVPFAAHLAPEKERGRIVGRVVSGLLLGILLARTFSSLLAAHTSWRVVYAVSAGLMLLLSVLLTWLLPERRPARTLTYRELMASLAELIRTEPVLRRRAVCQALMFGAFSCYWTSIAYELINEHGLSQSDVGFFALVGAAGAVAAPVAGRLGDHGHGRPATGAALVLGIAAMALAALGSHSLILLAAAGVLLDLAVQGHQVVGQREIYELRPEARARINTVYMSSVFIGGAIASGISGALYEAAGWTGVTLFGAALPAAAFAVWGFSGGLRGVRQLRT